MNNIIQTLHYIKHRPSDMGQKKTWLHNSFYVPDTAKTVKGIHNKEDSTVLKEMSSVLILLCIKSTQLEPKYGFHKTRVVIIQIHV